MSRIYCRYKSKIYVEKITTRVVGVYFGIIKMQVRKWEKVRSFFRFLMGEPYVSRGGTIGFPFVKRTFSGWET